MFDNIRADYSRYHRPLLQQGFWAVAFHRFGSWGRTIKFAPVRVVCRVIHVLLIKFSEIFFGIYIGPNASIGPGFVIDHFGGIIIHSSVKIGAFVRVRQGVTIGNKLAIQPNEVPSLGDHVDVGAGAKVLGKIIVGDSAVIGANAVVLKDVPAGAMAVGVPAKIKIRKEPPVSLVTKMTRHGKAQAQTEGDPMGSNDPPTQED